MTGASCTSPIARIVSRWTSVERIRASEGVGRGQLKAATPYRIETSTGGELGRERVMGRHRHCRPVDIGFGAQRCRPCTALIHMIIPCWLRLEELFCQFRLRQNRAKQASPLVPKLSIQAPAAIYRGIHRA
jgi:hypothetical protein